MAPGLWLYLGVMVYLMMAFVMVRVVRFTERRDFFRYYTNESRMRSRPDYVSIMAVVLLWPWLAVVFVPLAISKALPLRKKDR